MSLLLKKRCSVEYIGGREWSRLRLAEERGGVWVGCRGGGAAGRRKKSFVCSSESSVPCVAATCEIPTFGDSSGDQRLLPADSRKWVSSNSSLEPREPRNLDSPARAPLPSRASAGLPSPGVLECCQCQAPPPKLAGSGGQSSSPDARSRRPVLSIESRRSVQCLVPRRDARGHHLHLGLVLGLTVTLLPRSLPPTVLL